MARTFGGVSTDKIIFPASAALNDLVTQTWSVWIYRTASAVASILDKITGSGAGSGGVLLYFTPTPDRLIFDFYRWTTPGSWSMVAPTANAWHHVAVTYDAGSVSNSPLMYIDGVSQAVTTILAPTGSLSAETRTVILGNNASSSAVWNGRLAEPSAHHVVLTPAQVVTLASGFMAHTVLPANLRWYPPLWGLHSPEIDISTNLATGTVTGTVLVAHPPGIQETAPAADVLTVVNQILTLVQNTATLAEVKAQILTTALTESYAADGVAPTLEQFLFMMWSALAEFGIAGTTITCKRLNGSTTSMVFTLDSSTNPTSRTRTT